MDNKISYDAICLLCLRTHTLTDIDPSEEYHDLCPACEKEWVEYCDANFDTVMGG